MCCEVRLPENVSFNRVKGCRLTNFNTTIPHRCLRKDNHAVK